MTTAAGINVNYPSNITHHVYFMLDRENFDISRFFDQTCADLSEALKKGSGKLLFSTKKFWSTVMLEFREVQALLSHI